MKRARFPEEQVIGILQEHEAGAKCADLCRKHGMSEGTFYAWKSKYGGMTVSEAKRLKGLEDENVNRLAIGGVTQFWCCPALRDNDEPSAKEVEVGATVHLMGWTASAPNPAARVKWPYDRVVSRGAATMEVTTIGLDIAKNVFQVHAVDAEGAAVLRRKVRRGEVLPFFSRLAPCVVGIEACATSHHWARELTELGHKVPLIPPSYVKPYVRRGKNDAADAAAIAEAVSRPSMRFVPIKSTDQQAAMVLHRSRELLVKQRTMLINALRCHLAEFGGVAAQKRTGLAQLVAIVRSGADGGLPPMACRALETLIVQMEQAQVEIVQLDKQIEAHHRSDPVSRRLGTIPGNV